MMKKEKKKLRELEARKLCKKDGFSIDRFNIGPTPAYVMCKLKCCDLLTGKTTKENHND